MSDRNNATSCRIGFCSLRLSNLKVYQTIIFAMPALFLLVLILLVWLLYLRRRRTAHTASLLRAQFFTRRLFSTPLDRGLRKSFRDGLPIIVYDGDAVAKGDNLQCPVCLGDYERNEKLRQLPTCGHYYHVNCIDEWLKSNSTCPVCRCVLLPTKKIVPVNFPAHQAVVITSASAAESPSSTERVHPVKRCDDSSVPTPNVLSGESSHNHSLSVDVFKESFSSTGHLAE